MRKSIVALALLGLFAALSAVPAQDKPAGKVERSTYAVRSGDAAVLAEVLGRHFKGEADVLVAPSAVGQTLLISAAPGVTAEVHKLLDQLDRAGQVVEVEVILLDVLAKKGPFEKDAAEAEFAGPAAEVFAKLEALGKNGQLGSSQRIRLAAVEGQGATVTTGGNKPITTGVVVGPGGKAGGFGQRSTSYVQVGTTARVMSRIVADDAVVVDLDLKDNRVKTPEGVGAAGGPAADEPPEMANTTLTAKVKVTPGKVAVAQAIRTEGKAAGNVAVVLVTARVVPAGK